MLPLILYFVIFLSVVIRLRLKYDFENFSVGVTRYQLFIDKIHKTYSISEVMDNENTQFKALMQGDFIRKNDTITLLNSNGIKVIKDTLSGFAKSGKVVILK